MQPPTSKDDRDLEKKEPSLWLLLPIIFTIIVIVWLIALLLIDRQTGKLDDSFNGVNSLFSALAFGGVIIAIFLQKRELTLQRHELKDTRKVLEDQQKQLEAHTRAFRKQNFESTFFSMLNLHHTLVNSITIPIKPGAYKHGRDCFENFYRKLREQYNAAQIESPHEDSSTLIEIAYSCFYQENQSDIGHYFRNLYNVVRFVRDSDVEHKYFYIRLVRAQLSVFELTLLFYNCLSSPGQGFKPLVEEFSLLKTVDNKDLIRQDHRKHYKPTAFGESTTASTS